MGFWQYLKWSSIYILSIVIGSALLTAVWRDWAAVMNFNFLVWDAEVLYRIVKDGYDYYTVAFYPMFPWFWKVLSAAPWLMSLLNGALFLVVASLIGASQKMSRTAFLLHLSWPSILFMVLPYSEALLFVLTFCFLHFRGKASWILAGLFLFLMSLTKPTAAIMLPALCIAEWLATDTSWSYVRRILYLAAMIIAGNFLVWYDQFLQTGEWFIFFRAQSEIWQQSLSFPTLPLATWDSNNVIWLDAAALYFTLLAVAFSLLIIRDHILQGSRFDITWLYAVVAMAGTGMFVLCFRQGMLFSLNRFVFASAFFLYLSPRGVIRSELFRALSSIGLHIAIAVVVSLLCGGYQHIRLAMAFAVLSTFLVYYVRHSWFMHFHWGAYVLLVLIWCFAVFYGQRILAGQWVA
jgi:hypothetical protein